MSIPTLTRRHLLGSVGALIGRSVVAPAQTTAGSAANAGGAAARLGPRDELVNVPEFEEMAKLKLPGALFSTIASESREAIDRITLRPRALIPTMDLDLSVQLFGVTLDPPILVGPTPDQKRFHPDGELAVLKAAAAAHTVAVISSRSSVPIAQIANQAKTPWWYEVAADETDARAHIQEAVTAGCRAVCLSFGAAAGTTAPRRINWSLVDGLKQTLQIPLLLTGVMAGDEAKTALQHRVDGLVVSKPRGLPASAKTSLIEVLPRVADAAGGKVPVLLDETVQRGQDVFKALALGARAVLVSRPTMWGLAAYGPEGIQSVLALLTSELARTMGSCGKVTVNALDRTAVRIHANNAATGSR
jgi:isopentenyl diphosphate isomerase/L-lactate dehydrogenase-like FMN-dependent dehydrogenase